MPTVSAEIVAQAFRAAQLIVKAGADAAFLRQDIEHAETALHTALSQTETRVALLHRLAQAHAAGQLPEAAYHNLLATIGRMLKSSSDFTAELARITQPRRL